MEKNVLQRTWISPFTCVTFTVVGVTGLLLAFHIKSSGIKALHEWIGYAFTLAGVMHLLVNWKTFTTHFRNRAALLALFAGVILSLAVLSTAGGEGRQARRGPPGQLLQTFDLNGNGVVEAAEISVAAQSLGGLDSNHDGTLSAAELSFRGNAQGAGPRR